MNSGKEFYINNPIIETTREWIRAAFMPHGVQILWFEIIPQNFIQISQVQEIKELTNEEIENLNKPDIVEQEDTLEPEALENSKKI